MEKVPKNLRNDTTSEYLKENGYERIHQGKVRDTYFLDKFLLLLIASDRISIFDFVLNALVPFKGEVLTALTHFWLTRILKKFDNHLEPSELYPGANAAYDLRESLLADLPIERCLVVKNFDGQVYPFEMIFRHHIGGSVYKKYLETGKAGGNDLPPNLPQWSKLDKPIFTPSTKEEVGHDVNVNAEYFFNEMEKSGKGKEAHEIVELLMDAYSIAYAFAEEKGILIVDTKMEAALRTIIDEILTPDSSRYVFKEDWKKAMKEGRDPQFLDKEPVRIWGKTIGTPFFDKNDKQIVGINKLDPENPEHVDFVHSLVIPEKIIQDTADRYLKLFVMITGVSLEYYQRESMGV